MWYDSFILYAYARGAQGQDLVRFVEAKVISMHACQFHRGTSQGKDNMVLSDDKTQGGKARESSELGRSSGQNPIFSITS